ncbi:FMR1-interacting protein NUFIP1 [Bicyclus anynana]|uniref:FMR1-interacting protein NUFIP1 n=1 Tax=Bicyclus anynana TaxID=110368 RepID=A0A6J1NSN9_BICAN|nr:FMR1-interacting protein NUFIP1 [Bicyclus anynana]
MQRFSESWNVRRPEFNYQRYKENVQWNRPHSMHMRGNTLQSCDYQHWCETCDKGFTTARFLETHKLQHQKCNIDGCQFVAHPKIITKHIQMQHSTGLFQRISKLNNPEDIKKWREERRKRYPTLENIKKKEAETKEKINRGEKMGLKFDRNRRYDNKTGAQNRNNQQHLQTQRTRHSQEKYNRNVTNDRKRVATNVTKRSNFSKRICKAVPAMEESRTLKPFEGIRLLQIDDDLDEETESESPSCVPIEDDEDTADTETKEVKDPAVCSALTSLICNYESSDEDDIETKSECKEVKKPSNDNNVKAKKETKNNKINNQTQPKVKAAENVKVQLEVSKNNQPDCKSVSDDESGPEEVEISKEGINLPVDETTISKTKATKELPSKKSNVPLVKRNELRRKHKLPSTLLQKLLHKEIQHERNLILQCIRYVVKNKYFENSSSCKEI